MYRRHSWGWIDAVQYFIKIAKQYANNDLNNRTVSVVAYGVEAMLSNLIIIGLLLLLGIALNRFVQMPVYACAWLFLGIFVADWMQIRI